MTRHELNNEYFQWMCQLVKWPRRSNYSTLLSYLHSVDFEYIIPMDGNRAEDGVELRYRFGYENDFDAPLIASYLDDRPCSVLEMMVALALRCEEHIADDPDIGNRTGLWFWEMVKNLGLMSMRDNTFDEDYAEDIVTRFLNRDFKRDGRGSLFTVQNCEYDLRTVEIWYQMCWYLNDVL